MESEARLWLCIIQKSNCVVPQNEDEEAKLIVVASDLSAGFAALLCRVVVFRVDSQCLFGKKFTLVAFIDGQTKLD